MVWPTKTEFGLQGIWASEGSSELRLILLQ